MKLALTTYDGPADKPPLVIAHGLFGSGRNWGVIAKRLSNERRVITVDMRNHAGSDWADEHRYMDLADDLLESINNIGQPVDILGHSMGGKAAMALALTHGTCLHRAIVADIAPVTYAHSQMAPINAMRSVDLTRVVSRNDAADMMQGIEDELKPFLLQSLDLKAKKWRLNLDVLAHQMDEIIGFPDIDGHFPRPVFFLSGAQSDYVTSQHRAKIKSLFPKARFAKIPGAGHWLHAEKPREFEASVRAFLNAPEVS